ncbi:MAG: hypothetical protein GX601_15415, partial [Anaerolineales bacterium]|nr:hypothetical protein [Anaerolineales bacterium]
MVVQLSISEERSQRQQTRTAEELARLVRVGQGQTALEHLIFFTPPADFAVTAHAVEASLRATFAADDPLNKRRCLTFWAELALALRSFLPRWNLQDEARHGAAALGDDTLRAEADRLQATAMRLGNQVPRVRMELLSAWRQEASDRLAAEAVADPIGEARALVGNSIDSYIANVSAEVARSNLLRIAHMRAVGQTPTQVSNDYAAFLPYALYVGASYVTCNPPLVDRALASDPQRWNPLVDALIQAQPQADPDTLARLATLEVVLAQMRLLRPIFLLTDGQQGFVCLQVNPHTHGDAQAMISDALDLYARARARLNGGTPNMVFKLPGTRAGLEACRALTGQGIGTTITVNFGLFQHLPFAEAIQEGRAVSSYLVEMNGRLAFPVRDEMLARLDHLAALGISEAQAREAAAWAGVAVIKRAHALLKQRGYDLGRV